MPQLSIDPIRTYYSVSKSLVGRILLFYLAGWVGVLLGRFAVAFRTWSDLTGPKEAIERIFSVGGDHSFVVEVILMVAWPVLTAAAAAKFSILLFFIAMPVIIVTFAVFIYTEEPPPAWGLAIAGFVSIILVIGFEDATLVTWLVLAFMLGGVGAAFWWALLVFHPELIQTLGDLFRGRSSRRVSVMSERHKAPPGTWPDPAEGWANRPINPPPPGRKPD